MTLAHDSTGPGPGEGAAHPGHRPANHAASRPAPRSALGRTHPHSDDAAVRAGGLTRPAGWHLAGSHGSASEKGPASIAARLWSVHWLLLAIIASLAAVGAVALYSSTGGTFSPRAESHVLRFLAGLGLIFAITAVPLRLWMSLAYPLYALALVALALVPVFGTAFGGATRWIMVGPVTIQPSEFMKVAVILAIARYFQWVPIARMSRPVLVAIPLALVAAPVALILPQPDLGTSVLLALTGLSILFLAGVSWWYFLAGGVGVLAALPLVWTQLEGYQRQRVLTFLQPELDPLGSGYQILQSKIAIAAGGLNGKGLLRGTQSQLGFLPENHTDFIFPMIAEEFGFVGSVTVLGLYAALFLMLLVIALRCASHFARLLAGGTCVLIFVHTFVNVAMVLGLLPVVGAPLPLISHGGTFMITVMVALGFAMNAHVHRRVRFVRSDIHPVF